jgi:hypothetical protein
MMRWAFLVSTLFSLFAVAAVGCSGDDDEAAVRKVVLAAIHEAKVGSVQKACDYLAPGGEQRFVQFIRTHFNQGVRSCEEALRFERVRGGSVSSTRVRFTSVVVRDDGATVELVEPDSDDPTGLTVVRLEKLADKWKISESRVEPLWASLGD